MAQLGSASFVAESFVWWRPRGSVQWSKPGHYAVLGQWSEHGELEGWLELDDERYEAYRPLAEYPMMYREFVRTGGKADRMAAFANKYGSLYAACHIQEGRDPERVTAERWLRLETFRQWQIEQADLRHACRLWGLLVRRRIDRLEKAIKRDKEGFWYDTKVLGRGDSFGLNLVDSAYCREGRVAIAVKGFQEEELKRWTRFDVEGPAKYYLMRGVNAKLRDGLRTQIQASEASGACDLEFALVPRDLASAMWFQLFQDIVGIRRILQCGVCARSRVVSGGRHAFTCSDGCRQKAQRMRDAVASGERPEDVAVKAAIPLARLRRILERGAAPLARKSPK